MGWFWNYDEKKNKNEQIINKRTSESKMQVLKAAQASPAK